MFRIKIKADSQSYLKKLLVCIGFTSFLEKKIENLSFLIKLISKNVKFF